MQAQYLLVLCSFREQLQQHVRVHAVEAVMACREIEQNLQSLTGNNELSLSLSIPLFDFLYVSVSLFTDGVFINFVQNLMDTTS